jgi:hypothetical protein
MICQPASLVLERKRSKRGQTARGSENWASCASSIKLNVFSIGKELSAIAAVAAACGWHSE